MNNEIGSRLNRQLNPTTVKQVTEEERLSIETKIEQLAQEIALSRSQQPQNSDKPKVYNTTVIPRDNQNK